MTRKHNRIATLAMSAAMLLGSGSAGAAVIAHWNFDEGTIGNAATGAGSITDVSGNGHHGTPFGSPPYVAFDGGTGLDFDGSNDRIFVSDSSDFRVPSLTVEAVIEVDSLNTSIGGLDQIVFRGDSRSGLDPFYLGILSGKLTFYVEGSGGAVRVIAPDLLPIGAILHVAGTINDADGAMKLYINGVEVDSTTTVHRPDTLALSAVWGPGLGIGNLQDSGNQYLDGRIGEARLSDVALAPSAFLRPPRSVPEPVSLVLLATGAVILLGARRRCRA